MTTMATKTTADPLQKLEELLTCPVCLELYKNPKALPCQHTFCQDCLGHTPVEIKEGKYFLNCPSCRKPAQFPDGGVPAFPPAFTINCFLELHQEMLAKQGAMECPQHKRPLEAFCDSCQELVCFACATRHHSNHGVNLISDIIRDCKQQLEEGLQPVRQQIATVMNAIKDLDTCNNALVHQGEAVEQQIHTQAQEARAAVDQAERKLIQEVRMAVQQKGVIFACQREEAQDELARLQSSMEFVEQSLKICPEQQIVASKRQMLHRLKNALSRMKTLKLQPVEENDLAYEKTANFADECSKLGVVKCSFLHQKCGLNLKPAAAPGKEEHGKLLVRNNDGSPFPISTNLISCQLTARDGSQSADCTVRETGAGKYEISYTPLFRGPHQLRVMVGGSDIPGSEFSVVVPPSKYPEIKGQTLYTVQGLKTPSGVAVSRHGLMIVSERKGHCITIFSSEVRRVMSVGSKGSGRDQFNEPKGVAVTGDNCILVADSSNHRIQVLTMQGKFLTTVGSHGKGPLQFKLPTGIAVHSNGQILVSEDGGHRIHVLNSDLTFSHTFGEHGLRTHEGKFNNPIGIAVDSQGAVYVADCYNSRVQKFSISGQFLAQFGAKVLVKPSGLAIDASDYIYVTECYHSRISIFTNAGIWIKHLEITEIPNKGIFHLFGLAITQQGKMYICDDVNSIIMKE